VRAAVFEGGDSRTPAAGIGYLGERHQSLLHFVGNTPWSDVAMLAKVGELVLPVIERSGPIDFA
jgi:hypothetical protein